MELYQIRRLDGTIVTPNPFTSLEKAELALYQAAHERSEGDDETFDEEVRQLEVVSL